MRADRRAFVVAAFLACLSLAPVASAVLVVGVRSFVGGGELFSACGTALVSLVANGTSGVWDLGGWFVVVPNDGSRFCAFGALSGSISASGPWDPSGGCWRAASGVVVDEYCLTNPAPWQGGLVVYSMTWSDVGVTNAQFAGDVALRFATARVP